MSDDIKPADPHAALRLATDAATQGEWYHVNPFMVLPATRTVHGPVPAERVDYVSTHPGLGTPPGNRVVIPMARDGVGVRSEDMAYIALCSPPRIKALLEERDRLEAERDEARDGEARWLLRMADVRIASGIGVKPMLDEVPAALAELRARAEAAEAEARKLRETLEGITNALGRSLDRDFGFWSSPANNTSRAECWPAWNAARAALASKTEGA